MENKEIRLRNVRLLIERLGDGSGKSGGRTGGQVLLADKIGKSPAQVNHFAGSNPKKPIGDKIARQIEHAFAFEVGWLDRPQWVQSVGSKPVSNHDDTLWNDPTSALRRVPIMGAVEMDDDGYWLVSKEVSGFVQWHADESAYALQIDSDYLQARLPRGTIVIFEDATPEADDLALVMLKDGRSTILIYQFESHGRIAFSTIPDDKRVTFAADEVKEIRAYAGTAPARKRVT